MAYALNEDFAAGLDLRKSAITAKAGGLRVLKNAFVGPGGEIERRKKFSLLQSVPNTTFGLSGDNNRLYVFGTAAPASVTVALPVVYQQIIPSPALGGGVVIDRVLDTEVVGASIYSVIRFTDGSIRHFYGSAQIASVTGQNAKPFRNKVYVTDGRLVRFSAVGAPTDFTTTANGAGSIDVTATDTGVADLVGIEPYYNFLALFGRRSIQLWSMASDPAQNQFVQTLASVGCAAPYSPTRYGNGDVLFLSDTGIRSVRARDSSNAAILNDIGSPIDSVIQARRLTLSAAGAERIRGLIDPLTGHFWLVWDDQIYLLAYYPLSKVTAWSIVEPGLNVDYATVAGNRIAFRSGNDIYVYGDASSPTTILDPYTPSIIAANEYDGAEVVIQTPFLDFGKPATRKVFTGIDIACEGTWKIELNTDPLAADTAWEVAATVVGTTYSLHRIPYQSASTHIALRATSTTPGRARIASLAMHYEGGDSE